MSNMVNPTIVLFVILSLQVYLEAESKIAKPHCWGPGIWPHPLNCRLFSVCQFHQLDNRLYLCPPDSSYSSRHGTCIPEPCDSENLHIDELFSEAQALMSLSNLDAFSCMNHKEPYCTSDDILIICGPKNKTLGAVNCTSNFKYHTNNGYCNNVTKACSIHVNNDKEITEINTKIEDLINEQWNNNSHHQENYITSDRPSTSSFSDMLFHITSGFHGTYNKVNENETNVDSMNLNDNRNQTTELYDNSYGYTTVTNFSNDTNNITLNFEENNMNNQLSDGHKSNNPATAESSTETFLPKYKCTHEGIQCIDDDIIAVCSPYLEDPQFSMSCSQMVQGTNGDTAYGYCDNNTDSCMFYLNTYTLSMSLFLFDLNNSAVSDEFSIDCQNGGAHCADNYTLVLCSGETNSVNYAVSCAAEGRDTNGVQLTSFCHRTLESCVVETAENFNNEKNILDEDELIDINDNKNSQKEVIVEAELTEDLSQGISEDITKPNYDTLENVNEMTGDISDVFPSNNEFRIKNERWSALLAFLGSIFYRNKTSQLNDDLNSYIKYVEGTEGLQDYHNSHVVAAINEKFVNKQPYNSKINLEASPSEVKHNMQNLPKLKVDMNNQNGVVEVSGNIHKNDVTDNSAVEQSIDDIVNDEFDDESLDEKVYAVDGYIHNKILSSSSGNNDYFGHDYVSSNSSNNDVSSLILKFIEGHNCKKPGWQCFNDITLMICTQTLEVFDIINCRTDQSPFGVCDFKSSSCIVIEERNNSINVSNTPSLSKYSDLHFVGRPCSYSGLKCISESTLAFCGSNLTYDYAILCSSLLPNSENSRISAYCDNKLNACQVSGMYHQEIELPNDYINGNILENTTVNQKLYSEILSPITDFPTNLSIPDSMLSVKNFHHDSNLKDILNIQYNEHDHSTDAQRISTVSELDKLGTSCSEIGMFCISNDTLAACGEDFTVQYLTECKRIMPAVFQLIYTVYCDKKTNSCQLKGQNTPFDVL